MFEHDPDDAQSLPCQRVTDMQEDMSGSLWLTTDGCGLLRFDTKLGRFQQFQARPDQVGGLPTNNLYTLRIDDADAMWIGTQGSGLLRWSGDDRAAGRAAFSRFTERDGLPNNNVYGILEDEAGQLWFSTNNGLGRMDKATESVTSFGPNHGVQSLEFNFGAAYRGPGGKMYFGGINGFNAFSPQSFEVDLFDPPIRLTNIFRANERVRPSMDEEFEVGAVELTHRDYAISFEFASLDYVAPEKIRYSYKLEGRQDDWVDLGRNRRVSFPQLPAGDYTLLVRGTNSHGEWSPNILRVPVVVAPPPWLTWWAYTLYGLAIAGIALAYSRAQARKLQQRAEYSRRLELEVQARTRELAQRNKDLEVANTKLEEATLTDPLTGLRNRRYLTTRLKEEMKRHADPERDDPPFLFVMVDLDGLKQVNDRYGHLAGDRAILRVCHLLERVCRRSDTILRWGGDEFMVVAQGLDVAGAETLAERIRQAVASESMEMADGSQVSLSCSVGFAQYPFLPARPNVLTWEQVIAVADRALYIAKTSGRNAWASILGSEDFSEDALELQRIIDETEAMVQARKIRFSTSIRDPEELVWERA